MPRSWPWSWWGPGQGALPRATLPCPWGPPSRPPLGLAALYTASIVARTLGRGSPVTLFELLQGTAALVLGLGGAWELLAPQGLTVLGGLSLLLGALSYAAAFAFVERRTGHARNFYFYSTVGSLLTLVGSRALLDDTALSVAFCLLALASAGLGRRFARSTLRFHAALYLVAAAFVTDLLAASWRELFAPGGSFSLPGLGGWITAAAAVLGYAILAADRVPATHAWARLPQAILAATWRMDRRRNAGGGWFWPRSALRPLRPPSSRRCGRACWPSSRLVSGAPRGGGRCPSWPGSSTPCSPSAASSWSPRISGRAGRPRCS